MKGLWKAMLAIGAVAVGLASAARALPGIERDLAYGPGPEQRLDLTVPTGHGFATVIFVHGGSLTTGDKADSDYGNVCAPFPAAGIACANVNYRLAPASKWPAQPEDVAAATAWVRKNIASRGGDPTKLFLFGHSSGAMLVAAVGSDERYLAQQGMRLSEVRGVIPMGSIMWDLGLEQEMAGRSRAEMEKAFARDSDSQIFGDLETYLNHWPMRHVRAGMPAFLFLIAEAETEHPPVLETDKKFVEEARKLGNSAEYRVMPGRTHYSAIRKFSEAGDPVFQMVQEFVEGEPVGNHR